MTPFSAYLKCTTYEQVYEIRAKVSMHKNGEYDQEIPQSQTADKPMAPREEPHNNHETPARQTKQSNKLLLLYIIIPNLYSTFIICAYVQKCFTQNTLKHTQIH